NVIRRKRDFALKGRHVSTQEEFPYIELSGELKSIDDLSRGVEICVTQIVIESKFGNRRCLVPQVNIFNSIAGHRTKSGQREIASVLKFFLDSCFKRNSGLCFQ